MGLDREVRLVEAKATALFSQDLRDRLDELAFDDVARERLGQLFRRLRLVAEVRQEASRAEPLAGSWADGDEHEAVSAGEAGQVAHVDERLDEQDVELAPAQLLCQALDALRPRMGPAGLGHSPPRSRAARSSRRASP